MNCFLLALTALVMAATVYADDDWHPCRSDYDCDYDDCCVEDRFSRDGTKLCRDRGDDPGDLCGGYYCGCERGYECVPHRESPDHPLSDWLRHSNGTCQYSRHFATYERRRPPTRRYYVPDFDDLDDLFDDDDDDHDFDDDRRR